MNAEARSTIGLIGLGLAGKALAARLLEHGYPVVGHDIAPAATAAAEALGVRIAESASAVAGEAELVLLSLPDSPAVEAVLWGPGRLGLTARPGAVLLDTTTARPEDTVAHHERLRDRGVSFVDVTLVGSSQEIARGESIALVGDGEPAPYGPVLDALVRRAFYFGGAGHGNRAKLIVNLVLGLNRLVLAEGLGLATKAGMDPAALLEALRNSSARSAVMDTKGQRMLTGDFQPVARLAQHAKDVNLILDLATSVDARTPLSELHARLLQEAIGQGWGALDNSAVIKLFI